MALCRKARRSRGKLAAITASALMASTAIVFGGSRLANDRAVHPGAIEGYAVTCHGDPAVGASVTLFEEIELARGSHVSTVHTDSLGRYCFPALKPGAYRLILSGNIGEGCSMGRVRAVRVVEDMFSFALICSQGDRGLEENIQDPYIVREPQHHSEGEYCEETTTSD